jgi:hypothetical protein
MKTIVYVDGYNLYYVLLRHTPNKWLDLHTLFSNILREQNPSCELLLIKYFTSPAKAKFSSKGILAPASQNTYHKALMSPRTGDVEIIKGFHTASLSNPMRYKYPPNTEDRVPVWKLEEKQTDVNLALHIYRDATKSNCDQIVVCSADSDIAPALALVKKDYPHIRLGAIFPLNQEEGERRLSTEISTSSHWFRRYVLHSELERAQLPNRVPTGKKPADKPSYW